jgi:hypothetical protein
MKPEKEAARSTAKQSAPANQLTPVANHTLACRSTPRWPLNTVIGSPALCAWQPVPGVTWIQTNSPTFARKLSQRQDSRLIARGVAGGYLRTFEVLNGLAWARRLIARYTRGRTATNEAITGAIQPPVAAEPIGKGL